MLLKDKIIEQKLKEFDRKFTIIGEGEHLRAVATSDDIKKFLTATLNEVLLDEETLRMMIYDYFPQNDKDFKEYKCDYSQTELRNQLAKAITAKQTPKEINEN